MVIPVGFEHAAALQNKNLWVQSPVKNGFQGKKW